MEERKIMIKDHWVKISSKATQPKTLGFIVILQTLIIIILAAYILPSSRKTEITSLAQQSQEMVNQDVAACLKLPPTERPTCARIVGMKIATLFDSPEERLKECMKLRPLWVRYCHEGLTLATSPTPELTLTPTSAPTEEPTPIPTQEPTSTPTEIPTPLP